MAVQKKYHIFHYVKSRTSGASCFIQRGECQRAFASGYRAHLCTWPTICAHAWHKYMQLYNYMMWKCRAPASVYLKQPIRFLSSTHSSCFSLCSLTSKQRPNLQFDTVHPPALTPTRLWRAESCPTFIRRPDVRGRGHFVSAFKFDANEAGSQFTQPPK